MSSPHAPPTDGPVDDAGSRSSQESASTRLVRLPLSEADRMRALEVLSGAEAERQRRTPSDAFLLGRLLLQQLAVELTGEPIVISAVCPQCGEEHGRPVSDVLWLSVAHADDVVVAAAAHAPVGVDVERADAIVPADFGGTVAAWTRLEAVLKADGRGVVVDPADVHYGDDEIATSGVTTRAATVGAATIGAVTVSTATVATATYDVKTSTTADGAYVLSVATSAGVRAGTSARAIPQKNRPGARR